MNFTFEHLAKAFAEHPVKLYGFYRTYLDANMHYHGHKERRTEKCGLIIGMKGSADFIYNSQRVVRVFPGKTMLGGYDQQLELKTGEEGLEYCLIHYMPIQPQPDGTEPLLAVTELNPIYDAMLPTLAEQLQKASSMPSGLGQLEKQSAFYRLLHFVLHAEFVHQNKKIYPMMEETMQYIQTYYMEMLTLEHLAGRYQVKPKYFSHLFRKYTGSGPIEYLIGFRMDRAHEMLMTGRFTVAEVARNVGYRDAYYFSRLFKKLKGMPPSKALL